MSTALPLGRKVAAPKTVASGAKAHDYRREALGFGHEIRSLKAVAPGRYEIDATGPGVSSGDHIRFTLKGSESLELLLTVESVQYRLIPENAWRGVLVGDDFNALVIHKWAVVCDACKSKMDFEFSVRDDASPAATTEAAGARIRTLGWRSEGSRHLCAEC